MAVIYVTWFLLFINLLPFESVALPTPLLAAKDRVAGLPENKKFLTAIGLAVPSQVGTDGGDDDWYKPVDSFEESSEYEESLYCTPCCEASMQACEDRYLSRGKNERQFINTIKTKRAKRTAERLTQDRTGRYDGDRSRTPALKSSADSSEREHLNNRYIRLRQPSTSTGAHSTQLSCDYEVCYNANSDDSEYDYHNRGSREHKAGRGMLRTWQELENPSEWDLRKLQAKNKEIYKGNGEDMKKDQKEAIDESIYKKQSSIAAIRSNAIIRMQNKDLPTVMKMSQDEVKELFDGQRKHPKRLSQNQLKGGISDEMASKTRKENRPSIRDQSKMNVQGHRNRNVVEDDSDSFLDWDVSFPKF